MSEEWWIPNPQSSIPSPLTLMTKLPDQELDLPTGSDSIFSETPPTDLLQEEVDMLRDYIRRVVALADQLESIDHQVKLLNACGIASVRLARLLIYQRQLNPSAESQYIATINEVIAEVNKDFNLEI